MTDDAKLPDVWIIPHEKDWDGTARAYPTTGAQPVNAVRYVPASRVESLERDLAAAREWNRQMVEKAAEENNLDGYRELGAKCASLEAELAERTRERDEARDGERMNDQARASWKARHDEQRARADREAADHHELIMAVASKYPGETRHQTALRYIVQAEQRPAIAAECAAREAPLKAALEDYYSADTEGGT